MKIRLTILLFALLIITNQKVFSQTYFNNLYISEDYPELTLSKSILVENNGYFAIGHRPTYVDRQIILYKLNLNGDTIWRQYYGDAPDLYYPQKVMASGSGYFIAGSMKDSVNTNNYDFFLSQFDSIGNLEWMYRYGGLDYESLNDMKRLDDGNIILAGSTESYGPSGENFYLVKTDSLGNLLWQQTFGGGQADIAYSVIETPDKGYVLSGGSNSFNSDYDVYIVKTDSLGNLEWQKSFDTGFDDNSGFLSSLSDGNFIIASTYPSGSPSSKGRLIKIDPLGEEVWSKDYSYTGGGFIATYINAIENEDGTIITGGVAAPTGIYDRGYILKIDPIGNKIWEREYYTRTDLPQYIFDIKPTADSGFVFCGFAFPDTSNWQRTWIVKLDCFGCDSNLCYFADSACYVYDCTLYPIDAFFTSSADTIDLAFSNTVSFTNSSLNTSARTWNFGDDSTGYTSAIKTHSYSQTGTYTVSLIVYHGKCTDTFSREIVVINSVGVNEISDKNNVMNIYPNPSSNFVNIEYETGMNPEEMELVLSDITGKRIKAINLTLQKGKITFDNQELESGIYLISLMKENNSIITKRMIVVK